MTQFGSLVVTKTLAGDLSGFAGGDFMFNVSCTATSDRTITINLASGSASAPAITGIPAGAVCTVTETNRANPGTDWTWGVIPAAGTTTVGANQQASVTITNTRSGGAVEGATGTPGHGVAGATGKPHITPPPTSALGSVPAQHAGDTWRIALLGLAALLASLLIFSPKTSPERRRR